MNIINPTATRRAFLVRFAVGPPALVVAGTLTPVSVLAANTPPDPKAFPADFAAGTLVEVTQDHFGITAPGYVPNILQVGLMTKTMICRGDCTATWQSLKVGDRVQASTYAGPSGQRIAEWVIANLIAGMGTISAIKGNLITVAPWKSGSPLRTLAVQSYTTVQTRDGTAKGHVAMLRVGDDIHYTATADNANPSTPVATGYMLHRLDKHA